MSVASFVDVQKEYEKNKELNKEDVDLLQQWLETQPHLPAISELNLIFFLHSCYYNVESTKESIERFYTIKAQFPKAFKNRRVSTNTKIIETILYSALPKLTPEGYRILFCKLIDLDPDNLVLEEHQKSLDMVTILSLHQQGTTAGHIIMMDVAGITHEHTDRMNPVSVQTFLSYWQRALPVRLKHFIIINASPDSNNYCELVKTYLEDGLVQVYGDNLDELYKLIPKACFPSDYGGEAESVNELVEKRKELFLEYEDFFAKGEKEIADESKRLCKVKKTTCVQ